MEKIYTLPLHHGCSVNDWMSVTRVPGGWIYESAADTAVFVPYSEEFMEAK